ncbi:MAG TPA: hypothetical protein VM784_07000 [Actinomycetota bacterium]|nr:hypothetical protein [Actinomycetota bacterium]
MPGLLVGDKGSKRGGGAEPPLASLWQGKQRALEEETIVGSYTEKLQKKAGEVLRADERLLAAVRVQPRGSTTGMAVGGLIGGAVAGRQASKAQAKASEGSTARNWPQGRVALGLTDQRLLAFNYTAMGKPKDLVGEFPLDQLASVEVDKKKVANALELGFADGSAIVVECAKLEKVGDFVSAFQNVKTGATT